MVSKEIRQKRTSQLTVLTSILMFIHFSMGIYIFFKNLDYYDYKLFELTNFFWTTESMFFIGKLLSPIVVIYEAGFVAAISPLVIYKYFYICGPMETDILTITIFSIWIIIVVLFEKNSVHSLQDNQSINKYAVLDLEKLDLRPIFTKKEFNIKYDFCFYLGPFSEPYNVIYQNCIAFPLRQIGLKISRADEIFGTRPIMEDIWDGINEAGILIADVSGRNPNVMYEIGLAHSIGKKVIIITQDIHDVPFDLQHYRCIIYNQNELNHLQTKLIATIKAEIGIV